MQRLQQLSREVEVVFEDLGQRYAQYQRERGLLCRTGCGECCLHPEVDATVLEMLPVAYQLINEGTAETTLDALAVHQQPGCFFYQRHSADGKKGQCSIYHKRPAICRMFGAAGYNGRQGELQLSVCKNIRADYPQALQETLIALESDPPPLISNGKMRINQIDRDLSSVNLPINQAIQQALEKVLFEQYYTTLVSPETEQPLAGETKIPEELAPIIAEIVTITTDLPLASM